MKLKDIFEVEKVDDELFMVCLDSTILSGMVKLNETAAFVVECLMDETSVDEIVEKLLSVYDVDREDAMRDVKQLISQLEQINALDH